MENDAASVELEMPVCVTLRSTSPLRGGATSISTISKGLAASKATAARLHRRSVGVNFMRWKA